MATTDFANKVGILAEFYVNYKGEPEAEDFFEFNDLGLPIAFLSSEGLVEITEEGVKYINETWMLFLQSLGLEDIGFESLSQVLEKSPNA